MKRKNQPHRKALRRQRAEQRARDRKVELATQKLLEAELLRQRLAAAGIVDEETNEDK